MAGLVWWQNQPKGFDAVAAWRAQPPNARATGRTGVLVVALIQPTRYSPVFYENFVEKLSRVAIPWPINLIALRDTGVALLDPTQPARTEPFTPRLLADIWGRTADIDGVPWVDKWREGKVDWVPPSDGTAADIGSFVYRFRAGGTSGTAQRAMLKARYLYYGRLPGGILPQQAETEAMVAQAFAELRAAHPALAGAALVDAFDKAAKRRAVNAVLDQGIDTLVLASALPIKSSFEELRGSYPPLVAMIDDWVAAKPGRQRPRLLIAAQMADSPAFLTLWQEQLANALPAAAPPGAGVTVIMSLHGLPEATLKRDLWTRNAARLTAALQPRLAAVARARGWSRVTVVSAQEAFADGREDPHDRLLSTGEVFRQAAARGDRLAVALPIEFMAENTDTLFLHSTLMFAGLPDAIPYAAPPPGTDWNRPYVRRHRLGGTELVYAGAPGPTGRALAARALAQAIAARLPISKVS
ncbi:hypothetical protein [Sandaracinobacteroides saxicola]|uniref:Ferrochelatase n=1 Tax=Sandaracinobacteroides saxicola TaxID=2759707 RepID=A0A7G5IHN5_9SPHN|nr:hypothetical protein [Sandaracinobacteroides saxicola]QMW22877.1 hypothetical protein H3309_16540 [Sandaracinobacteroides saxicola]